MKTIQRPFGVSEKTWERVTFRHDGLDVAGQTYDVLCDQHNDVLATECKGSWPMSDAAIGSAWIANQIQTAVYDRKGR